MQWSLWSDFSNSAVKTQKMWNAVTFRTRSLRLPGVQSDPVHNSHQSQQARDRIVDEKDGERKKDQRKKREDRMGKHVLERNMGVEAVLVCRLVRVESWRSIAARSTVENGVSFDRSTSATESGCLDVLLVRCTPPGPSGSIQRGIGEAISLATIQKKKRENE